MRSAGLMFQHDGLVTHSVLAEVGTSSLSGPMHDVSVAIEFYELSAEEEAKLINGAFLRIWLRRMRFEGLQLAVSKSDEETLELNVRDLEPLSEALALAVKVGKERGYIPDANAATAAAE